MHDWQSLSRVRWDRKYHVVIIPKYCRKVFYGRLRRQIGPILRKRCRRREIELVKGHAMPAHVHLCLSIPSKYSVAHAIGFLKGKSTVRIHRELLNEDRLYKNYQERGLMMSQRERGGQIYGVVLDKSYRLVVTPTAGYEVIREVLLSPWLPLTPRRLVLMKKVGPSVLPRGSSGIFRVGFVKELLGQ